jgi:hypothetical protein
MHLAQDRKQCTACADTVLSTRFYKMREISWLADRLSASGEGDLFCRVHCCSWTPEQNGVATTRSAASVPIIVSLAALYGNCGHNVMQGTHLAQAEFLRRKCVIITWSYPQHELHHWSSYTRRGGAPRRLGGGEGHTTGNPTVTTSERDVISRVT